MNKQIKFLRILKAVEELCCVIADAQLPLVQAEEGTIPREAPIVMMD